jgi:hypothetical protein
VSLKNHGRLPANDRRPTMSVMRHPIRWSVLTIIVLSALSIPAMSEMRGGEPAPKTTPQDVLAGLKAFWQKTALSDGSFRPGIDPNYLGMSDSALSDMAPITYAVTLHKTLGWKLPHEAKTLANLLDRQKEDGAFYHIRGTGDPKAPLTRVYNTTQGLVALHALGATPRYDPLPVFEQVLAGDYKKLPLYTTSFFPLAYQCLGKPLPADVDRKIRALMTQAADGYVDDHVAATFHLAHYIGCSPFRRRRPMRSWLVCCATRSPTAAGCSTRRRATAMPPLTRCSA